MDFNFSPSELQYQQTVRDWVGENLPSFLRDHPAGDGESDDRTKARYGIWQRLRYDAGLTCVMYPKQYGGAGLGVVEHYIVTKELDTLEAVPPINRIGFGMCLPMILHAGSETQKAEHLPPALKGERVWCQLFSEPGCGSDLAGLTTRAEPDGEGWRLTGQKTWTSSAHYADFGICLARSDPASSRHRGLTMFLLDMRQPAVEVRPIMHANGEHHFNEVFFDGARVEPGGVLGAPHHGWGVAMDLLMIERGTSNLQLVYRPPMERVVALARERLAGAPPTLATQAARAQLAGLLTRMQIMDLQGLRLMSGVAAGEPPGPEGSFVKLDWSETNQKAQTLALDLLGPAGLVLGDEEEVPGQGIFPRRWLGSFGALIAGGSSEILRNIVAERILGLPKDASRQ